MVGSTGRDRGVDVYLCWVPYIMIKGAGLSCELYYVI